MNRLLACFKLRNRFGNATAFIPLGDRLRGCRLSTKGVSKSGALRSRAAQFFVVAGLLDRLFFSEWPFFRSPGGRFFRWPSDASDREAQSWDKSSTSTVFAAFFAICTKEPLPKIACKE